MKSYEKISDVRDFNEDKIKSNSKMRDAFFKYQEMRSKG